MKKFTPSPPIYPLSRQLSEVPIYMMMQLVRTAFAYRTAVAKYAKTPRKDAELRFPHYAALITLEEHGEMSQKELGQRIRFDPSDLVTIIDELETQKYLRRTRDEQDRRRYKIELTPAGSQAIVRRQKDGGLMTDTMFAPLSRKEFHQLVDMLQRVDAYNQTHFDEMVQEKIAKLNNSH